MIRAPLLVALVSALCLAEALLLMVGWPWWGASLAGGVTGAIALIVLSDFFEPPP